MHEQCDDSGGHPTTRQCGIGMANNQGLGGEFHDVPDAKIVGHLEAVVDGGHQNGAEGELVDGPDGEPQGFQGQVADMQRSQQDTDRFAAGNGFFACLFGHVRNFAEGNPDATTPGKRQDILTLGRVFQVRNSELILQTEDTQPA